MYFLIIRSYAKSYILSECWSLAYPGGYEMIRGTAESLWLNVTMCIGGLTYV